MRANPRDVDAILARFPGPVTLYPSRRKLIGMLAIALGFVTISILLLRGKPADSATWIIWACLLFFGACALIGIVMLLPGAASLTLTAEGFEVVSLFRCMRTPWSAASGFAPTQLPPLHAPRVRGHAMVGYELADSPSAFAGFNRSITGRNEALPDTYGLTHEDLAWLMTQWRERALVPSPPLPESGLGSIRPTLPARW